MTRNVIDRKKREDDFKETLQREKLKSPTNYLDRTEMLMEDKYGKDWDKTVRNKQKIKGRAKTKEERYNEVNREFDKKVADLNKKYEGPKKDWNEYGKSLREFNKEYGKAERTRMDKISKENLLKTDTYKLKARTEKITSGENALQRYAQVSNSSHNLSNIKAKELPSGAIHITTKSGKDISTISPKALTTQQKNELRKKGILR